MEVSHNWSHTRFGRRVTLARSGRAFTLIELLVVIAIIAILAALLFPVLARAKSRALQAGCISNEKQVGIGLQIWVDENDGWLPPGPSVKYGLWFGQHPNYVISPDTNYYLMNYIAPSLALPPPTTVPQLVKVFVCPASAKLYPAVDTGTRPFYGVFLQKFAAMTNVPFNPFGYPPGHTAAHEGSSSRLADIQTVASLSSVWSLVDLDQLGSPDTSWAPNTPELPIHNGKRNYLFFDGHVAAHESVEDGKY
jgi:prepilin-type N-terminal cleavage/methylation domain-containing protein/prepilin-type processing-associated H-X9-DG protein